MTLNSSSLFISEELGAQTADRFSQALQLLNGRARFKPGHLTLSPRIFIVISLPAPQG